MKRVAAIQMASGPKVSANLTEAGRLIQNAVDAGAQLVVLPENFAIMGNSEQDKVKVREPEGEGPIQSFLAEQAMRHKIWIVGGTIPLAASDRDRIRAACLLYDDQGKVRARYDKIHLFDVHMPDIGETYNESATIEPGTTTCVVDTPFGRLGLAVCYDLRFPELFRRMVDQDVEIVAVPAAFTAITGKAHWDVLVRSRAIENLCYLIAAAQGGYHINGRETHGDSMIVDPWGNKLIEQTSGNGPVTAQIDMEFLRATRHHFPSLRHRRIHCK